MDPSLWTSLFVAMHDDIENRSIHDSVILNGVEFNKSHHETRHFLNGQFRHKEEAGLLALELLPRSLVALNFFSRFRSTTSIGMKKFSGSVWNAMEGTR